MDIETPAALIDEARMAANIDRMQKHLSGLGVRLRPHVKTSKCIEVARRQQEAGAKGITVSTLKEAEQFFAAGFADILYAVCMAPEKLDRALALIRRGCGLTILVDSVTAAQAVVAKGREAAHAFEVMIEIDSDGHRSGVQPEAAELIEIGRVLREGGQHLKGVLTHAGSSYDFDTEEALQKLAEQERALCVRAAERLRAAGMACPEVSVGSTPTALAARNLAGVTEVRAGVYVFFDLVMSNVGVCTPQQVALSVLATVIGHQPEKGWVIVDAGWMAMSRDRGTQRQKIDYGYGAVCDASGGVIDGLFVSGANQEHGIISRRDGAADPGVVQRFPIGTKLRLLPNHACATGAQYPFYLAVSPDGDAAPWQRFQGW
ncbi:DSD1 family PLP-dependent enzyme [Reyranella sp.]|uniref:DSD1 family PLP-dependent enzyme n=1 Tax=Reyranella sp. TaxID=1929291 RepID=UPI0012195DCE|nr:DSD1 family PLP-dependent enzyme [Reyranella sp.]TAJ86603.1 MAG: DSD1 family PLP-dependent enzyme [Reyranella sp.]